MMSGKDVQVCLGLGSNINPETNIPRAIDLLRHFLFIGSISSAWDTPPVGTSGPNFVNAALLTYTDLTLENIKNEIIRPIEAQLGRIRSQNKNAPRPIDIDVLIWDQKILEPLIWEEAYLAIPVAELLPDLKSQDGKVILKHTALHLASISNIVPRPDILPKYQY
jgi:2-amino-4-hydroxy-6-hydroxymethyldihydropteridine diphosphokinase